MRYLIVIPNGKFICEKDWENLVEVEKEENASNFSESVADQIIEYLGEGEKVPFDEN